MAKTQTTLDLERSIWLATRKQGVFCCFEVTIGWYGKERVDYMTYDTKGIWRCYEIKVSKADFHSKAALSFVGNFNYYVLTRELYEQVKHEIPTDIGVYVGRECVKRPKRRALAVDEKVLYESMIRSLYRYADDSMKCDTPSIVGQHKRENERLLSENRRLNNRNREDSLELMARRRAERKGEQFSIVEFERVFMKEEAV
jgi:hypothetical protein